MPIEFTKNTAHFRDIVSIEETEALFEWLQKQKKSQVNLVSCTHMHAANLQVLMAARPAIAAWPEDADLSAWLRGVLETKTK